MNEREKRIDEIETRLFLLNMKDFWNHADYELDRKLTNELLDLKGIKVEPVKQPVKNEYEVVDFREYFGLK